MCILCSSSIRMVFALNQPSANTSIVLIQNKKDTALKSLCAMPMSYDTSFVGKWQTKQTYLVVDNKILMIFVM